MEKYCTIPLVLDFMGRKFSKGLPSIMDREGVLENFDNMADPSRLLGWCRFFIVCRDGGCYLLTLIITLRHNRRHRATLINACYAVGWLMQAKGC